ncbi:S41 family peptidase [Flavobacterium rhizosphaerae]|uniref:S41 family peptidase n=1 Tax=Flavobacterium rhizosphaerae TaxID=3163298 RepID=A0ABW8YY92_9FLAO
MKKIWISLLLLITGSFVWQGCEDMDDTAVPVNDFIWKGLNLYYLWQQEVPNLADDRFANQGELNSFLESYPNPEALFHSLLYQPGTVDRWSVLFSDFTVLENLLQGVSTSNGADLGLVYVTPPADPDNPAPDLPIFGYVRYVMPNTDAADKGVQRGDIFYAVNGTTLTNSNYSSLLGQETYTLNLADYNSGAITPNGQEVTLTKSQYAEDPVYRTNVVTRGSHTIGYLMYNGFYSNYDNQLNAAFGELASQNVNELVLDLRYNSGGSVRTATYLGSMITGQFNGQLFAKQQWNSKLQAYYESENPQSLINRFTDKLSNNQPINSLNLNRVYILTTSSTASASELVINCLKPYIDVVVIGGTTTGKNVGSVTLYDSPDFSRRNVNGSHKYAMQPIVLKTVNNDGYGDYFEGIPPTMEMHEDLDNMGVLGEPTEPFFAAAIADITGSGRPGRFSRPDIFTQFKDTKSMRRMGDEMYIEEMPEGSLLLLKDLQ